MLSTATLGGSLVKRLAENPPQTNAPNGLAILLFLGDLILFLPVFFIIAYTLDYVYPTLAAVEDPLPAYEALPLNDDGTPKADNERVHTAQPGKPITSSIRATNRLIRSVGHGWLANFRGLGYYILTSIIVGITTGLFALPPFIPLRVALLPALILCAPLITTWTHLVITGPSNKSFFARIPPLKKTYLATWFPTLLLWAAMLTATIVPTLLARAIGLRATNPGEIRTDPPRRADAGKALGVLGVSIALQALLLIPAITAITRVMASLLPADEDAIVPFDRSFGGRVEPEVVTGKGFATFGAALKSIPRASWARIYLLRVKVFAVAVAAYLAMGAIVVAQFLLVASLGGSK
ncbi:hypothetical protein C8A01DRAFT_45621 [Parachaetomium inaequale]|uniref:Uncharacterized protein n=1 Tax=Parachaetomium inaequale TaxID=2588326 RepID=A0AAN6SSZ8_9PEZI|nr:hypothetical protein C8A01DRAFT_45621 [Parachaetomium inaequale]